ncbi:MAG: hypothetical protein GWP09_00835 [Nitrospiraceae bacterium]|nr:hypothetical protein [Nitrospiraceae bacterium]
MKTKGIKSGNENKLIRENKGNSSLKKESNHYNRNQKSAIESRYQNNKEFQNRGHNKRKEEKQPIKGTKRIETKDNVNEINYDLELTKAMNYINKNKAKRICIQLPDGLKPQAKKITDFLSENTDAEVFIWGQSCFGACDLPIGLDKMKIDLIIQWGHAPWRF